MAMRRALRSVAAPLARACESRPALVSAHRWFAADATQARTDASSKGRGAGSGGIRSRKLAFAEPEGEVPAPPRRVDTPAKKGAKKSNVPTLTIEEAVAGDIVSLAGMSKATVADTICALAVDEPLDAQPIDPPTITVTFGINDSPLAGRDGKKVQSRVIRDRLMKEAESNVAIKIADTPGGEAFEVFWSVRDAHRGRGSGRGALPTRRRRGRVSRGGPRGDGGLWPDQYRRPPTLPDDAWT